MPDRALVLLPGFDGTGIMFRPFLPHLPPTLRPIIVTYPPEVPKDYSQLLPLVLDSLPKDQPFVIVGESFSGPLAIMAAATHPPGLLGVVLCASFVRNPLWLRPRWLRHLACPFAFKCLRLVNPARLLLGRSSAAELRALLADSLASLHARVLACRAKAVLSVDVRDQLKSCRIPFLYLVAEDDRVVPRQNLREFISYLPKTHVVSIPAPHLLLQTRPAAAANAISKFLNSLLPAHQ